MAEGDNDGMGESASRYLNGGRNRGQRAFYNNTRAGLWNSATASETGSTYGGIGQNLSERRRAQMQDAEGISKHFRE